MKTKRHLRYRARGVAVLVLAALGVILVEVARLPDVEDLVRGALGSTVLLDRQGRPLRYTLTTDERLSLRVPLERIHPLVATATLAAEDARFRSHPGVDPVAVARAVWTNVTSGRIVSGASTITMQVARLLRPLRRSYYNKFREAVLAIRLELVLSKDEILELYLNLSPYGGNAHGVEAAARRYFGRGANDLSLSEAALLAALPQSPTRLRPDRHPEKAKARRNWILDRMLELDRVPLHRANEAKKAAVHTLERPLPFRAPHFGTWVLARVSQGSRLRTTLDGAIQTACEETVRAGLENLAHLGVRNAAAVVVETPTGKIRALIGSEDFFEPIRGQVNGAAAPRSPGSLLKPFIYCFAFEAGLAGPDTLLDDSPLHFRDGYQPHNFSRRFVGRVTAREALVRSLNVPAIRLLRGIGVGGAVERLRHLGLRGIDRPAEHYGLALGLGGVDVTLLELVEAYATLGRLGAHRPLSFREDEPPAPARQVIEAAAAYEIVCILEGAGWDAAGRDGGLKLPRVALKTGTSFGLRDAWALATTPSYTVGVWIGNFDAQPSAALVGRIAAKPVALELIHRLEPQGGSWFESPAPTRSTPAVRSAPSSAGELCWTLPPDGATFARHRARGGDHLAFRAAIASGGLLSFFVDGDLAGQCRSGETVTWPLRPGTHRVTLVTPQGAAEERTFRVEE